MAYVVVTASADRDLDDIVRYLAERGGRSIATRYLERFDVAYERLRRFPLSGHRRPKLGREVRIVVVLHYLIIYDWEESADRVTVLRVVRGSRRITKRLVRAISR